MASCIQLIIFQPHYDNILTLTKLYLNCIYHYTVTMTRATLDKIPVLSERGCGAPQNSIIFTFKVYFISVLEQGK